MKEKLKKITTKQKVTSIVVIIALVFGTIGGYFVYTSFNKGEVQATLDIASLYQDEIVTVGDITVGISESGTASLVYEEISLDSGYEVVETIAEVGLYVEEGDVIATLDLENSDIEDTDESDALKEAENALIQKTIEVEAALIQAKSVYDQSVATGENADTVYDLAIDDIDETLENYADNIEDIEEEIEYLEDQLKNGIDDDYSNVLELAAKTVTSKEAEIEAKEEEIANMEAAIEEAEATETTDTIDENVETTESILAGLEASLAELESQLAVLEAELSDAEDDYDDAYDDAYADASAELVQKESELSSAEKSYTSYKAQMDNLTVSAESTYNSNMNTYSNAYALYSLTVEELNEELEEAQELVDEAQAAYDESLEEDEDSTIIIDEEGNLLAPCTGYVTTVIEPTSMTIEGNTIESGLSITISDGDYAEISVSVSQDDIGDISLGMDTIVVFDSYEDMPIMTTVTSFSLTPSSEISTSVNYDVTVLCEIPQDEGMTIFASMTATVTFVEHQCTDVLLISSNYIVYEDAQQYVYVEQADGSIEYVAIETGFSDGFDVEIISGVEEGDIIINESAVSDIEN